jgi:RecJ-like exonuclease
MAAWSDHDTRDRCTDGNILCPICGGTGKLVKPPIRCSACQGTGVVTGPNFGIAGRLFFVLHKLLEMDDGDA